MIRGPALMFCMSTVIALASCSQENPAQGQEAQQEATLADPPSQIGGESQDPRARHPFRDGMWRSQPTAEGYSEFKECVTYHPDEAACWRSLGIAASYKRTAEAAKKAARAFREYLKRVPDSAEREEIEGLIDDLEAGRPVSPEVLSALARMSEDAEVEAPPDVPEPTDPIVSATDSYEAGVTAFKEGDLERATYEFARCIQKDRKHCRCYRNLGIVWSKRGQAEKAARYYRLYLKACPTEADVDKVKKLLEDWGEQ